MDRSLNRCTFAIIGIAATIAASGQTEAPSVTKDAAGQAAYGYAAPAREAYQGAWSATSALQDAALWKSLCAARPADVGAQLNWFRSERNARLATNNGSLTDGDAAELDRIAATIQRTAPGSFEHHLSTYYLRFPDPAAGEALNQARALAPGRSELLLPLFNRATRRHWTRPAPGSSAKAVWPRACWKRRTTSCAAWTRAASCSPTGTWTPHPRSCSSGVMMCGAMCW